jgi:hypothetical protein
MFSEHVYGLSFVMETLVPCKLRVGFGVEEKFDGNKVQLFRRIK